MPSATAQKNVQAVLDGVTGNKEAGISGLVFVAIDKNGEYITTNASGRRGLNSNKPMDLDTVFWIASCTKVLATIACLQAVEQGKLSLDDNKHLYKYCPEIERVKVLQEDGTLVDKKAEITLRMLLSHTAGYAYEFFNPKLRDHGRPLGYDVFRGTEDEILRAPLTNQPGSRWEYGVCPHSLVNTRPLIPLDQHRLGRSLSRARNRRTPGRLAPEARLHSLRCKGHNHATPGLHDLQPRNHAPTLAGQQRLFRARPCVCRTSTRKDQRRKITHSTIWRCRVFRQTKRIRESTSDATERRREPHHTGKSARAQHGRGHVQQPDPAVSRVRSSGYSGRETRSHQPFARGILILSSLFFYLCTPFCSHSVANDNSSTHKRIIRLKDGVSRSCKP